MKWFDKFDLWFEKYENLIWFVVALLNVVNVEINGMWDWHPVRVGIVSITLAVMLFYFGRRAWHDLGEMEKQKYITKDINKDD